VGGRHLTSDRYKPAHFAAFFCGIALEALEVEV